MKKLLNLAKNTLSKIKNGLLVIPKWIKAHMPETQRGRLMMLTPIAVVVMVVLIMFAVLYVRNLGKRQAITEPIPTQEQIVTTNEEGGKITIKPTPTATDDE